MKNLNFRVNHRPDKGTYDLEQIFPGLMDLKLVKGIFLGHRNDGIKIKITNSVKYMRVLDENGTILISANHLKKSDKRTLLLDILHELVHVRQHMENKKLYDERFEYVDRPTEIEAYMTVVKVAREIGMTDEDIREYLEVEWITEEQLNKLLDALRIKHFDKC